MKENLHMKKLEAKQIVRPLTFENRDSLLIMTQCYITLMFNLKLIDN